jgi:hypothetical protein
MTGRPDPFRVHVADQVLATAGRGGPGERLPVHGHGRSPGTHPRNSGGRTVTDHQHYEYADDGHRHDGEYAEYQHRHYDDESAVRGLREDLAAAENRIRALENSMSDAFALIRRLDRLRPTCVICLDATADRQTSRGPACTDCVGDPPEPCTEDAP